MSGSLRAGVVSSARGLPSLPRALALGPLLSVVLASAAFAESSMVVVSGLGGDPQYVEGFSRAALDLVRAALAAGVPEERIELLTEDPTQDPLVAARSSKDNVLAALARAIEKTAQGEDLWVVLIGHGSFREGRSQLNLPGPDIDDLELEEALAPAQGRRIVFVNAATGSGGFVETLSGPDRVVVTATKSAAQRNDALFAEHFVAAFSDPAADADRNQRISVFEAFGYAGRAVERHFETSQLLRTEHALLDDNGDGVGSTHPDPLGGEDGSGDGLLASRVMLGGLPQPAIPAGLEGVAAQRAQLTRQLDELRRQRTTLSEDLYELELERLLLEIARLDAELRRALTEGSDEGVPEPEAREESPRDPSGDGGGVEP